MIKFQFLSENKTDNPGYMAEHGLSIYIETGGMKILFDTGASDLFLKNAKLMKVDISQVDACIISHGHYDHTQGVPDFCKENKNALLYIHKDAFGTCYGLEDGEIEAEPCSIIWTSSQRKALQNRIFLTDGVYRLTEDIIISGTIPSVEGFTATETFYEKQEDGSFLPDPMNHEQFLIIRDRDEQGNSKGLFLFSGCSHKGVLPVLRYTKALFQGEEIKCLTAGMHLYSASADKRKEVIDQLLAEDVGKVIPVHCTGINAICELKSIMGDDCIVATAGDTYEF